jgi:HEAT repeat protein
VALPFMIAWVAAPFILKANYSKILLDLIAKNMLDIKSMDQKELGQIFNQEKTLSSLEASFLSARGKDAVWYAKLLKNFSSARLDELIVQNLKNQDDPTQVALIKMITPESGPRAARDLIPLLSPDRPETTIAILKLINQHGIETGDNPVISGLLACDHPVIRGFAGACIHGAHPEKLDRLISDWLAKQDPSYRQSGIICAGLSRDKKWIPQLKALFRTPDIDPVIPDIIIALSRLDADDINALALDHLTHARTDVRMAALDALSIIDDDTLQKAVLLIGDPSDEIHEFAREKIRAAGHQNPRLLVESLGLPSTRIRKGLFNLLDSLDIKEFDVLLFAKKNLKKSYDYLAMAASLENLPQGPMRDLAMGHLMEKKELVLENIIRVLAIHDQTGRMRTAWQGIFSADKRQRANAIELLNDILDRKTFNTMIPLLESPTIATALADGKKQIDIPEFSSDGKQAAAELLSSPDWVDVVLGLGLVGEVHDLQPVSDWVRDLAKSENPHISKEVHMILKKTSPARDTDDPEKLSLGEKILLLKEIDIFSGLSASELAAIASVTEEMEMAEEQEVIKQNSIGETVYLIIDGQVSVIMEKEDGGQAVIDQMDAGAAFGEMALIDNSPRSATIRTITPCRFLTLHKQEFKETAMEFPRIALQICSVLSQRIRHLHSLVQEKKI